MSTTIDFVRGDPAGNITLLVLSPVPENARSAAARALLERCGGEQAGFLVPPALGGDCRLEMMGGEFCGNALRALGKWWASEHPGTKRLRGEISGCSHPLELTVSPEGVRAEMPLPREIVAFEGRDAAVFPGIVHLLDTSPVPSEDEARALTRRTCGYFSVPAAGVMTLSDDGRSMTPAVYVRDTDTLFFESSCASGAAAAAAILSRGREGESVFALRQPGGTLTARALRTGGQLIALSVEGPVSLSLPESAEAEL